MSKPRLLDFFCGAGGAAMGYHRAGFDVVGVDIEPQPHYPFEFVQADAMAFPLAGFDVIHASPPCQAYGSLAAFNLKRHGTKSRFPKLIGPVRERLLAAGCVYVIENTSRAPLRRDLVLCGSTFGLAVRRHRVFETNALVFRPGRCRHTGHSFVGVFGDHPGGGLGGKGHPDGYERAPRAASVAEASIAMGIDWMTWREICESIPPAYTQFIGEQLIAAVECVS